MPAGSCVQIATTGFSAVATGTTVMPIDDTIPQSGEGDQYMTQAITPRSASNRLVIDAIWWGANTSAASIAVALFQDSTANALSAVMSAPAGVNYNQCIPLRYTMLAGTTSSTTFKIRAGSSSAGTTTFNGVAGGRFFGAIDKSSITIREYTV